MVYIVTKNRPDGKWEFQGVFSTKEKAIAACKGPGWGYGPEELDVELPEESIVWEGFVYPHG